MAKAQPKPMFFATAAAFRGWLERHHERTRELLVGFYKRGSGKPSMTWPESVDEALCFGWIDGVRRSLGEDAYTIRFTPRKATSIWSTINVAKAQKLIALGRMHASGARAFAARRPDKTGLYSFERTVAAQLTAAQAQRLAHDRAASAYFAAQPPWYRRAATHWVVSAKREETRERRLSQLIEASAAARPIGPLARPIASARKTGARARTKRIVH